MDETAQADETSIKSVTSEPSAIARVAVEYQDRYQLLGSDGTDWAQLSGVLRRDTARTIARPAVGDWVGYRPGAGDDLGVIEHLFDRRSQFVRQAAGRRAAPQVVAANLDTVFVVTSPNEDFNPRRIERYLATVWDSGALPTVVLNKIDLCQDCTSFVHELEDVAPGVPVLAVSALARDGANALREHIRPGETVALVGSSGVGKSTLVNWLVGDDVQDTGAIREDDGRGRHTTTHRELIPIPGGGLLIDTPGMRELKLWHSGAGIEDAFADVEALAARCRFRDCGHQAEPGCAVRAARDAGELDDARLASYFKLKREQAFELRRQDDNAAQTERRKWKVIQKAYRQRKRIIGR